ncbi:MAG: hypothetical protein GX434_04535 [Peptococcaceae bacterium]|nr:hypothetical protein [Peptococcaceae bacterium]
MTDKLNKAVPTGLPLEDIYFFAVKQRKELNLYDKAIYKMALKVWLGFEGNAKVRTKLQEWEKEKHESTKKIFQMFYKDHPHLEAGSRVVVRILESMIQEIILNNEEIPDQKIKEELFYAFRVMKQ